MSGLLLVGDRIADVAYRQRRTSNIFPKWPCPFRLWWRSSCKISGKYQPRYFCFSYWWRRRRHKSSLSAQAIREDMALTSHSLIRLNYKRCSRPEALPFAWRMKVCPETLRVKCWLAWLAQFQTGQKL